jgi:hypothetical protein
MGESQDKQKRKGLWQSGDLFHIFSRYPRQPRARKVDRLAHILHKGLVAPAADDEGLVCSDVRLVVIGSSVPYDRLVFLHRFGPRSGLYTMAEPGRCAVFIDPAIAVLTPAEMGAHWVVLCQDEVYVRDRIAVEQCIGLAVHPTDVETIMQEFLPTLQRLGLPLFLYDGTPVWPEV